MSETITRNINLGYSITGVSNPDKYHVLFENVGNTNAAIYAQGTKVFDNQNVAFANNANIAKHLYFGDASGSSTAKTASITGITTLEDGIYCILTNNNTASASGWTLNINSLGAKPVYVASGTGISTSQFGKSYTALFVYDSSLNSGSGGWRIGTLYNSNTQYSVMTAAEMITGTATSARTLTATVIKSTFDISGNEESGYDLLIRGITGTAASKTQINNLLNKLERGSKIFWGSSQPTTDVQDGDIFVNTDNDDVYARINNSWEYQYNIGGNMGPSGAKGVLGAQGSTGIIGAIGNQGVTGAQGITG